MDKQLDELSKSLAEGVSRRQALREFGIGLAGVLLAAVGIGSSRTACAQGTVQCCTWTCDAPISPKHNRVKVKSCGSPCPNPGPISSGTLFCGPTPTQIRTVSDCTACL